MSVVSVVVASPGGAARQSQLQFAARFCGIALAVGGLLALAGWYLRPVVVDKGFDVAQVTAIGAASGTWVLSFRMLVFGLFIRIAGLVAIGTLHRDPAARAIVTPAVTICVAGLLVSAMAQGYYMDIGIHAVWRFSQEAGPAAREAVLRTFIPTDEWVSCLGRMGLMFLGLGSVLLGWGIHRGRVVKAWSGWALALIGMVAMMGIFFQPASYVIHVAAFTAMAAWHAVLGAVVLTGGTPSHAA